MTVCSHPLDAGSGRLCRHLLADEDLEYILRFTGRGIERELVCPDCREAASDNLVQVCASCLEQRGWPIFDAVELVGAPQILTRSTSLRFDHREVLVPALASMPLHTVAPVLEHESNPPRSLWLGVTQQSELVRIDLDDGTVEHLGQAPVRVDDGSIALVCSDCARFAALVSRRGRYGAIIDLRSGAVSMVLDRGDYYASVSDFSLAFVRDRERTLVIHATDWNRLDVSDPATGERLTTRTTPAPEHPHFLNYFHAGLTISPDQRWLIDDGWVWHPVGVLCSVDLQRWIHEHVWATEDRSSRVTLREVAYFWDGPRCFSPDGHLIVGGFGPDDELMVDAALIFDPASGELQRWFAGPPRNGTFVFDQWLFASAPHHGTSVWDLATGERVCHDPGLLPSAYHPGVRCFVTLADGRVLVSALVG